MPINPSALGDPKPEDPDDAPEVKEQIAAEQGKRKRRTKAELIADAVVPGNNDQVELKDSGTGAKIERPWLVAVEMIRDGKAEFADKAMKYAMLKYDEQKAADEQQAKSAHVPPDAEPGDEVQVGDETLRVGHGGVLTTSPVVADPPTPATADTNGKGSDDVQVETLPAGTVIEEIGPGEWKVGTGVLEKIGLPDYSSLQIGPITASRTFSDHGALVEVMIGDRKAMVPAPAIPVAHQAADIVEYIARYQRGELVSFLESTGALKQPASGY